MAALATFIVVFIVTLLAQQTWKGWNDPAFVLGRQAAKMNWAKSRYISEDGYKNMCVMRDGVEVMIRHHPAQILLIKPQIDRQFHDFEELEHWLSEHPNHSTEVAPTTHSEKYNPTILAEFAAELDKWPTDQAQAASYVVKEVIEHSNNDIDDAMDQLTAHQMQVVADVISKIRG